MQVTWFASSVCQPTALGVFSAASLMATYTSRSHVTYACWLIKMM
jgi:hypothetical protein